MDRNHVGYSERMRKTQIAASAFAAFWQGLVLQCALLALVVLFFGAADLLRIYCAAMAAQGIEHSRNAYRQRACSISRPVSSGPATA